MRFFPLDFRSVSLYVQYFFSDGCYVLLLSILLGFNDPNNISGGVEFLVHLIPQFSPSCYENIPVRPN
jgi:hypothetical protein